MKSKDTLFLALLVTFSTFFSCKKDDQKSESITDQIQGAWELKTSSNGSTGQTEGFPKGNGNVLSFSNSNYKIYSSSTLIKSGTFQIIKEESTLTKEVVDKIIYDNENNSTKIAIKIDNDLLIYSVDAFDGSSSIYERK